MASSRNTTYLGAKRLYVSERLLQTEGEQKGFSYIHSYRVLSLSAFEPLPDRVNDNTKIAVAAKSRYGLSTIVWSYTTS